MSFQSFPYQYRPNSVLVNSNGTPTSDGIDFLLALYNRTGAGTGIIPVVSGNLTATGTTISNALQLMADWNLITSAPSNSGVQIPASLKPGNDIWVYNSTTSTPNVYPPSSSVQIDRLGNGAPFQMASGELRAFQCWTLTQFVSFGT